MRFQCPVKLADEAAGVCNALGALGCEIKRPAALKRARLACVDAYFDRERRPTERALLRMLTNARLLADDSSVSLSSIEDPGWATMWQERFAPLPVGRRLLIVPPWNRPARDGRINLVIKPGQAFGTGHHASTFGTLSLIEPICRELRPRRALDVGAGSGILAIAMSKLGAGAVTAIDIDPLALENARENAELNRVADRIRFSAAPLRSIRGRFDLITANILSSVLIAMAAALKLRLRPRGFLILAGILAREADTVAAAYDDLNLIESRPDGRWRAMLFQKP